MRDRSFYIGFAYAIGAIVLGIVLSYLDARAYFERFPEASWWTHFFK